MKKIFEQSGVIGILIADVKNTCGRIFYLRYDPYCTDLTDWDETSKSAFNDARAGAMALLGKLPQDAQARFYLIDWMQYQSKPNIRIEGRSLTLAAALCMLSYHTNVPVSHAVCTGDMNQEGDVLPVDAEALNYKFNVDLNVLNDCFNKILVPSENVKQMRIPAAVIGKVVACDTLVSSYQSITGEKPRLAASAVYRYLIYAILATSALIAIYSVQKYTRTDLLPARFGSTTPTKVDTISIASRVENRPDVDLNSKRQSVVEGNSISKLGAPPTVDINVERAARVSKIIDYKTRRLTFNGKTFDLLLPADFLLRQQSKDDQVWQSAHDTDMTFTIHYKLTPIGYDPGPDANLGNQKLRQIQVDDLIGYEELEICSMRGILKRYMFSSGHQPHEYYDWQAYEKENERWLHFRLEWHIPLQSVDKYASIVNTMARSINNRILLVSHRTPGDTGPIPAPGLEDKIESDYDRMIRRIHENRKNFKNR